MWMNFGKRFEAREILGRSMDMKERLTKNILMKGSKTEQ